MTGDGRARYAAAMALHAQGLLGPDALEVYRICSLRDRLDPAPLLAERGLAPQVQDRVTAEGSVLALLEAADLYLTRLQGPGVAETRHLLSQWRGGPVTLRPKTNSTLAHLPAAMTALETTHPDLAQAIAGAAPHLSWTTYDAYDPDMIGEDFATNHCFTTLIGENATIPAIDFDFGLFLIAPHILYRDHHHAAPELYAPLTGPHGWRFAPNRPLIVKQAHQPVWNDPYQPHLTKVGPTPFLAFFAWTRDTDAPAKVLPADDWAGLEARHLDQ